MGNKEKQNFKIMRTQIQFALIAILYSSYTDARMLQDDSIDALTGDELPDKLCEETGGDCTPPTTSFKPGLADNSDDNSIDALDEDEIADLDPLLDDESETLKIPTEINGLCTDGTWMCFSDNPDPTSRISPNPTGDSDDHDDDDDDDEYEQEHAHEHEHDDEEHDKDGGYIEIAIGNLFGQEGEGAQFTMGVASLATTSLVILHSLF